MPAAAQLIDATKKYGAIEALRGVSLDIELGDVVAMLGPNGAGKTTSISLLLGLRNPTSGKALLFGLNPNHLDARSRVGVMLQESGIPAMLKVREIVDLFRSYYPKPMSSDRAIAMAGLEAKVQRQIWRSARTGASTRLMGPRTSLVGPRRTHPGSAAKTA